MFMIMHQSALFLLFGKHDYCKGIDYISVIKAENMCSISISFRCCNIKTLANAKAYVVSTMADFLNRFNRR